MRMIVLLLAAWMLVGCNTMDGLSKDLKEGGEKIKKAVKS
jgi:predicted small secreted protein